MDTDDLASLNRSAIELDRLAQTLDDALHAEAQPRYPPCNVALVNEGEYRITIALAGFNRTGINIAVERNTIEVIGRKLKDDPECAFLHRGIAARDFEQCFELVDHVKIASASLENGSPNIELVREVVESMRATQDRDRRYGEPRGWSRRAQGSLMPLHDVAL